MTTEEFKEKVFEEYGDWYEFVESFEWRTIPEQTEDFLESIGLRFVEKSTLDVSDSYNFTDEVLDYFFEHPRTGKFFSVYGTNRSYNGTEITGVKEVKRTEKIVVVWE